MKRYEGPAWKDALRYPLCVLVFTVLAAFVAFAGRSESDWLGGAMLGAVYLGILLTSVVALIFSVMSFRRKEKMRYVSLLTALPAGIFLLQLVATIIHEILMHHR